MVSKHAQHNGSMFNITLVRRLLILSTISWLSLRQKPLPFLHDVKTTPENVFISSELAVLPEKMCCIWISTRDVILRKFYLPTHHRYGLDLQITRKNLHAVICIMLAGDIATNPGPFSVRDVSYKAQKQQVKTFPDVKCILLNARSLKSVHKSKDVNMEVCNLQLFQDLVYADDSDIVCVNETWLNKDIMNSEILHPGYTIYRKDRQFRRAGGVLIAVKTDSFKHIQEYISPTTTGLEIVSAELETNSNQKFLFCCCYRPPDADQRWITDLFRNFLDETCNKFDNIVISGDFNFPKISWASLELPSGVNDQSFVELLNDYFLIQHNTTPTRGNNVLDLVISSIPDQVKIADVLTPDEAEIFTDHCIVSFTLATSMKAPPKSRRSVYDYNSGDFTGLRSAICAANLSSLISTDSGDINSDWQRWKDAFLICVANFIPRKKLKGRNPIPWINGTIINLIRNKTPGSGVHSGYWKVQRSL